MYSSWKVIIDGGPQGSVLGPLLFNIFINDLFLFVENSEICNYADDNTLTAAVININTIISNLECDIKILRDWFRSNGLLLNEDKCQFMIIDSPQNSRHEVEKLNVEDTSREETETGKILGIIFDNKLTMCNHKYNKYMQAS